MGIKRLTIRALSVATLWGGFGLAQAQPPAITVESALRQQPRQPGVNIATPTPAQAAQCTVAPIPNPKDPKSPMGYVVRDPAGKPVRQFVSYDGKNYNIVAYYVDGLEAYREVYPPHANEAFQFRWLGPNGTKWGLDKNRDGKIDEWVVLSPEELSQELLLAVLTKDADRAKALVVTKSNLDDSLNLPAAEAQKLLERAAGAIKRTTDAAEALKLSPEAKWVHIELNSPQSIPKDAFGPETRDDLVTHKSGTVLVQDGKDTKFLQTGELVQIGRAWKLVEGPAVTAADAGPGAGGNAGPIPENLRGLVDKLNDLDQQMGTQSTQQAISAIYVKRAEVLEEIVAKVPAAQQDLWVKQLVDSLSSAADGEKPDGKHITRLKQIVESLAKGPNTALTAYAAFRFLIAENSINLANAMGGNLDPVQEKWRTNLDEFAKKYPTSDEAPEALLRLAVGLEYAKDGEAKAKDVYRKLTQEYARYQQAAKAAGALKRLESEGKPLELVGPHLGNPQAMFNAAGLRGKVVIVYYCANWSQSLPDDAKKLQAIAKEYGPKGVEIVTVCLDHDNRTAIQTVQTYGIPGAHLHSPGGLDASPLAAAYGIQVLPHMFVVDKDGKIVNRAAQAATLEDDVKKLVK